MGFCLSAKYFTWTDVFVIERDYFYTPKAWAAIDFQIHCLNVGIEGILAKWWQRMSKGPVGVWMPALHNTVVIPLFTPCCEPGEQFIRLKRRLLIVWFNSYWTPQIGREIFSVPKSLRGNVRQPPLHFRDGLCWIHKKIRLKEVRRTSTLMLLCFEWPPWSQVFFPWMIHFLKTNQSRDSQVANFTGFPLQTSWHQMMTDC